MCVKSSSGMSYCHKLIIKHVVYFHKILWFTYNYTLYTYTLSTYSLDKCLLINYVLTEWQCFVYISCSGSGSSTLSRVVMVLEGQEISPFTSGLLTSTASIIYLHRLGKYAHSLLDNRPEYKPSQQECYRIFYIKYKCYKISNV